MNKRKVFNEKKSAGREGIRGFPLATWAARREHVSAAILGWGEKRVRNTKVEIFSQEGKKRLFAMSADASPKSLDGASGIRVPAEG